MKTLLGDCHLLNKNGSTLRDCVMLVGRDFDGYRVDGWRSHANVMWIPFPDSSLLRNYWGTAELHRLRQYKLAVRSTAQLLKFYAWEMKLKVRLNGLETHLNADMSPNINYLRHNITGWVHQVACVPTSQCQFELLLPCPNSTLPQSTQLRLYS